MFFFIDSFNQSLPSTSLATSIAQTVFSVEFNSVAGASNIVPITTIIGSNAGSIPKALMINISLINPPPGIAPITAPFINATANTANIIPGLVISVPNNPNRNAIFNTPVTTEPSLCMFAPNGITVSAISSGTPICLAETKFTGIQAALEQVATAVTVGQEVEVKILNIDTEAEKMTLSIKALQPVPEGLERPKAKREKDANAAEKPVRERKPRKQADDDEVREWNEDSEGGASIAELLGGNN